MNKVIEYIIRAKDATAGAIRSAVSRVRDFASKVGTQLANIKAGFDMLSGVAMKFAGMFATAIREAFKFEKATSDFKVLLGSIDAAKAHLQDLHKFASTTPLTFGDLTGASKLLLSFGADVESIMPSLKMLGDISMGDSQKFQGLALVFAQVKSAGKLMGQDLLQMINQGFNPLAIIAKETGKSMDELKGMMQAGAISFEMVEAAMVSATSAGGLFAGAMDEAAKTGEGLMSTLEDTWDEAVREFGNAFTDTAKGGIQFLIDKIDELIKSGSIDVWAEGIVNSFNRVIEGASAVAGAFGKVLGPVWNVCKSLYEMQAQGLGNFVGTLAGGGGLGDAFKAGWRGVKEGFNDVWDADGAQAEHEKSVREAAQKRQAQQESKKVETKKDAPKRKSIAELMAESDEEQERIKAEKEEEKWLKKWENEQERINRENEQERIRIAREVAREEARLQRQNVAEHKRALEAATKDQDFAEAWLSEAQQRSAQAWGWYRDKDSLKAQLEEEKANAEAEKQFEKDFERLKHRGINWRTADNLSLEDEAVRRVGLAREEEKAAQQYAQETAEATREAADALEAIQSVLEEGGEE